MSRVLLEKMLPLVPIRVLSRRISSIRGKEPAFGHVYSTERFASHLETCVDAGSLRKIHALIFGCGLGENIFLGSKLLNSYAKFGGLSDSRLVFDRIINRNLSLWNSAIVGYFRAGCFEEVLSLYSRLKVQGIGLDSSAILFGLKSCVELGTIIFGYEIHADAFKVGLNGDKFVGPALIKLYFKCGIMEDVQQAFEEIFEKDVVAYTSMITGYAQEAGFLVTKAFEIAYRMHRDGLDANRVSLVSLFQAAGKLEALQEGRSIHCYALRRGIDLSNDKVLETSLVDMYAKCSAWAEAESFLRQTRRSVASWNGMITGLVHHGQNSEALNLFYKMVYEECLCPNSITIANVLSVCSKLNCDHLVTSIHCHLLRRELPLDLVVTTALVDSYSRCGKVNNVRRLFDQLGLRDIVLYNVIIPSYLHDGAVDEVIMLLNEMFKAGVKPSSVTMLALLSGFADLTDIRRGRCIHGFILRHCFESEMDVSNQIINMYAKCGFTDVARKLFDSIKDKDLVSWTTMMMAYVNHGHADEALALFWLMRGASEKPDSVTLITLLQAISQLGLLQHIKEIHSFICRFQLERDAVITSALIMAYAKCGRLDLAESVFNSMEERRLTSWNTMIAAYGMHGCCKEVLTLFHRMQSEDMKPNGLTFSSVLSACSHAGLAEEAWHVFRSMNMYSIAPQEEHHSSMVDLLARSGQLEQAYDLLKCSPTRNKTSALCALLGACRVHRNLKIGEAIGKKLLELEPDNSSIYAMVSNLYAEAGKWNDAANLRIEAREKGLRKIPGYSSVESDMNLLSGPL